MKFKETLETSRNKIRNDEVGGSIPPGSTIHPLETKPFSHGHICAVPWWDHAGDHGVTMRTRTKRPKKSGPYFSFQKIQK
jgi:hypothetical protein